MGKVLAPHASVTRDNSLQSSVQRDFRIIYFPFLYFYFFVVDKGVAFTPTYPQVR